MLFTRIRPFFVVFSTLLLSNFWTSRGHRCRPSPPPCTCLQFLSRIGSAIALLVDNSSSVANSSSRASASQFVHKKKFLRIYTSMHSGGLELTKLIYYTWLEANRYATGATCCYTRPTRRWLGENMNQVNYFPWPKGQNERCCCKTRLLLSIEHSSSRCHCFMCGSAVDQ